MDFIKTKAYGQITISSVKDGENGKPGQAAINVVLSNESQNIPCTNNGVVPEQMIIDIEFSGYLGLDKVPVSVEIGVLPSGMTVGSKTNSTTTTNGVIKLSIAKGATLGGNNINKGKVILTFTIQNRKIAKEFSWCKTRNGAEGSMVIYELISSTPVFNKEFNNTITPSKVTFKAQARKSNTNITEPYNGIFIIKESTDGSIYTTKYTSTVNEHEKIYTLSSNNVKSVQCVLCEANKVSNELDIVTIPVLSNESVKQEITEIKKTVNGVSSKVDAVNKSITDKVWQTDITTQINNYDNNTIKTMRDQVATNKTEIGKITSEVSDVKTTLTTKADGTKLQELENKVATHETTAEGFKQTVIKDYAKKVDVNGAIDALQVGARNLIPNTDFGGKPKRYERLPSMSSEGGFRFKPTIPIVSGESYVLSLDLKGFANVNLYQICSSGGNVSQTIVKKEQLNKDKYNRYIIPFKVEKTRVLSELFICTAYGDAVTIVGDWFEIAPNSLKVEKGTKATDWTPAPEDFNNSINSVRSEINQKAGEILTSVEQNYTTKTEHGTTTETLRSEIKQTSEGIENKVNGLKGDLSIVSQKVGTIESTVKTAQGEISSLKQTANKVETEIKDARGNKTSLKLALDGIQQEVNDNKGNITNLTQTSTSISTEIKDARGGKTSLKLALDGIQQGVNDNKGNLSILQQTATDLTSKVQSNTGEISNIKQKAGEIELSVSNVKNDLSQNYYNKTDTDAKFKVQDGLIQSTVSKVEKVEKDAVTSTIEEFYHSTSATSLVGGNWSTIQPTWTNGKFIWRRTKITKGDGKIEYTPNQNGVCITGNTGAAGQNGTNGIGISKTDIAYAANVSGTVIPNSGWGNTIPNVPAGQFLWTRTTVTYTDSKTSVSYSVSKNGINGNNGVDGNGIKSATATYQTSADGINIPTGSWTSSIPKTDASKPYLWTRVITTYTNGSNTIAYSVGSTIDGVAVGGRNLLLKSDVDYTNTSYPISIYTMSEKMVEGITYTCQIWGTLGSGKTHYGLWLNGGMIHLCNMTDNKDGTHTATFVGKNDESEISTINVYPVPSSVSVENTIYRIKLEKGNQATDYTVAPEDLKEEMDNSLGGVIEEVSKVQTQITQLKDEISMLVVDENGTSLMTQKGDRWEFNMGAIQDTLSSTADRLNNMTTDVDTAKELANKTQSMAEALNTKTAFITMGKEGTEPYILLGQGNSDFKLRISNTSIDFLDGTEKVAYISNKVLYITKAIIKDELQFGDTKGWVWKHRTNGNLGLRWMGNIKDIEPEVPEVLPEPPLQPEPPIPQPQPEPQFPPNDSVIDLDSSDVLYSSTQWKDRSPNQNHFTIKEGSPNITSAGLLMTSCKVWGTKPIALNGVFSYLVELTLESESTGAIFSFNQNSASKYCDNVEKNTWKLNGYSGDTITSVVVPSYTSVKIAVVRDSYGNTKVYKNGALQGSWTRGTFNANGEFSIVLGASSWGGFPNTQGTFRLKRLRIFNKVISDDVIREF